DDRIADLDLRMADGFLVWTGNAKEFFGSEGFLVEVDRLGCSLDDQMRGERVVSLGNRCNWVGHGLLLLAPLVSCEWPSYRNWMSKETDGKTGSRRKHRF